MFQTNLKIAWRNLMRNRVYSFTNIGGLAVGITAFLMTLLYETHLAHFDAWDPGFKDVYQIRLVNQGKNSYNTTYLSPHLLPLLNVQIPDIKASTRVLFSNAGTLLRIGETKYYEKGIVNADSTFFAVFPFALKSGDRRTALQDMGSIVISEELAEKYFKGKDPMGQHIRYDEAKDFIVTGVLAKLAGPTQTNISALMRIKVPDWAGWGNFEYKNYVRLDKQPDTRRIADKMTNVFFNAAYNEMKIWEGWPSSLKTFLATKDHDHLELLQISQVALEQSKGDLIVLAFLSSIILIVACINFVNQTIANSDSRAKEIGVRKVMGGLRTGLAGQFLLEIFLQCFFAIFVGLILVELLLPYYNRLINEDITFLVYCGQPSFLIKLIGTLLGVTLISGLYPALYLSAFTPARVLKGNFERGSGGLLMRKILLGLQFSFSLAFIICLIILSGQIRYMQNFKTGFEPSAISYIMIQEDNTTKNFEHIKQRLLQIPHLNNAALTDYVPWWSGSNGNVVSYGDKELNVQNIRAGNDYLATLGVKMRGGREFNMSDPQDTLSLDVVPPIILNEATVKVFNIPEPVIGQLVHYKYISPGKVKSYRIIGVAKDFMLKDFKAPIGPAVFLKEDRNAFLVVLNIDPQYYGETMEKVSLLWKEVEPVHPIIFRSIKDDLDKVTESYTRLEKIVSLLATVTIIIAIIGLLALVAYNLKKRMKEIGIRKVVGASLGDILSMITKEFLYLLLIANVFGWLIAYLLMSKFLGTFVFRIDMPWGVYPLITLISVAATLIVISARVWKAIRTTPAEVLKYE